MVDTVKSILESKFVSHSYPYIEMLQQYSDQTFDGFYLLAQEIEHEIYQVLKGHEMEFLRFPDASVLLSVEEESNPVFIYRTPDSEDEFDFYKIGRLTTYSPNSHTEKPSGIILSDGSYLQIDFTFAHSLTSLQMYLMFLTFHYGRCNENREEFYFFRFDKESNYMITDEDPELLDYKSVYHFHGNCDEPHFPLPPFDWKEKIKYVVQLLAINLKRIELKTGQAIF